MSVKNSGLGAGVLASSAAQLLFVGRSLNFQSTADQPLTRIFGGSTYVITDVIAKRVSGSATVACIGGLYDGASKSGNILVLAAQSWLALGVGVIVSAPPIQTALTSATPILSLTTGSLGAVIADLFVFGFSVD